MFRVYRRFTVPPPPRDGAQHRADAGFSPHDALAACNAALAGRTEAPHKHGLVPHLSVTMKRRSLLPGTTAVLNAAPDGPALRASAYNPIQPQ